MAGERADGGDAKETPPDQQVYQRVATGDVTIKVADTVKAGGEVAIKAGEEVAVRVASSVKLGGEVAAKVAERVKKRLEGSKPQAPNSWLVTEAGRVKMIHAATKRNKKWQWEEAPREQDKAGTDAIEPIPLEIVERPRADEQLEALIYVDPEGNTGFEFEEGSLRIASASEHILTATPLDVNDVVTAVNGFPVQDFEAFQKAIAALTSFTITFRSPPSTEADRKSGQQSPNSRSTGPVVAIEFDQAEVAVPEHVGKVKVPVRRAGDLNCRLEWRWWLKNCTVVDKLFQGLLHKEGTVVFEETVKNTWIEIEVPQDPTWNAEAIHFVHLDPEPVVAPEGVKAMLGDNYVLSLYSCNTVSFPAGVYGRLGSESKVEPSLFQVIKGFVEHNYTEIPGSARRGIALSFIPPILTYLKTVLTGVMVDCGLVVQGSEDAGKECPVWGVLDISPLERTGNMLIFVVLLRVVLLVLEHIVTIRFRMLKLGGQATVKLRANMFTTMLQLTEQAREAFDEGDVAKALDTEVDLAVQSIWLNAFTLQKHTVALFVKLVLTFQVAIELEAEAAVTMMFIIPVMLLALFLVLQLRGRHQFDLKCEAFVRDENWSAFVTMASSCNQLIVNYTRGWFFTDNFAACHKVYNGAAYKASAYESDTLWILKYIFQSASVVAILIAGNSVRNGGLSVGSFLVLLSAVEGFGSDLHTVAGVINSMVIGSAAVRKLAEVLNSETRRLERALRNEQAPKADSELIYDGDIILQSVQYKYPSQEVGVADAVPLLDLTIPAGNMIVFPLSAMVADGRRPGIHTLFKIISGELLPTSGKVLLPNRWRCIYVPVVPILFDGTLMYNLMFSSRAKSRNAVWDVCRALGLSHYLIEQDDFDVGSNGSCLKFSDKVIISITRALMHDVDVLLISSALDVLGEARAIKVLRYLRRYAERRGLPQEPLPEAVRHRKTVIYTSKFAKLQEQASHRVMVPDPSEVNVEEGPRGPVPRSFVPRADLTNA